MKRIKDQVELYMQVGRNDNGAAMASFIFPPEFVGFQGHFPGKSILPGACQLQCLLSLLESVCGKALALQEIVLAKYILPVIPDQEIRCVLADAPDLAGGEFTVRAFIFRDEEKVTELKVRVATREAA